MYIELATNFLVDKLKHAPLIEKWASVIVVSQHPDVKRYQKVDSTSNAQQKDLALMRLITRETVAKNSTSISVAREPRHEVIINI